VSEQDLIGDVELEDESSGVPVLPLRDVVVYPHMVIPLFVGRDKSIVALDIAMAAGKRILLVAQKAADLDDPQPTDLYEVGTLATILQLLKLPDGTVKVLVEGSERALIDRINVGDHFSAEITMLSEDDRHDEREIDVLVRSIIAQFEQYVKLNKKVPPEILTSLSGIDEPGRLADTVAAHMALKLSEKQRVLEIQDVKSRLEQILGIIEGEIDVLHIEKRIRGRVKQQIWYVEGSQGQGDLGTEQVEADVANVRRSDRGA
jgi:ATP-dependent Lon protease